MQKIHFCQSTRCGQDKTKFPYSATFPLRLPHPKLIKIGNPLPLSIKIPASDSSFELASRISPQKKAKSCIPPKLLWTLYETVLSECPFKIPVVVVEKSFTSFQQQSFNIHHSTRDKFCEFLCPQPA